MGSRFVNHFSISGQAVTACHIVRQLLPTFAAAKGTEKLLSTGELAL